ncbi:hypothetical protein [Planococcus halotolerans]|uniref:hypothetical protein n=1 Tax=Planococcus halotolerans TaxID=2233542 RepID=UPI00109254A1|nr:hypothetical protein [Planococcus halotolerans]QHJ71629.1 hypothetical protein DNR44_013765 [Planococcus halotolerans]
MLRNDTVRLNVQFRDFNGNAINPESVKLVIYDKQELVVETITEGVIDLSQGNYFYDYTADSDFIYEFSGIYFGKPVVAREAVQVKFN